MVVAYGREAFRICVETKQTPMASKRSWADLVREAAGEKERSPHAEVDSTRNHTGSRKRTSSHDHPTRRETQQRTRTIRVVEVVRSKGTDRSKLVTLTDTQSLLTSGPKIRSEVHRVLSEERGRQPITPEGHIALQRQKARKSSHEQEMDSPLSPVGDGGSQANADSETEGTTKAHIQNPNPFGTDGSWTWIRRDLHGLVEPINIQIG
ncbi:hypothetical protein QJS10_CPB14g01558 [Acorus calamus]|uniref:Uncharacterized protein n=1 Tax=Acorus calamus TaxID=4465 RepID=A0AAV9DEC6_ACOCL|nr:hypothetical protein QJS10_CPB14g01558 [Acorus calamus]